ncbi:phosphoribosylanthranilate isomerase [Thermomonas aquatica]|uniref:N-(5'-phosphoribosyl)anthranilate isomerase n=1 Tax=Thermomonas aquatica TaxID=2202149 RepID=A0A5B7ZUL6_9GAMM|nr:phosphoribosylanthranilate isomerase [Thermomonas aquatica]QDA58345.1 phosphoribosylanthranilate isomerase [Thermomonas aquatica]
MVRPLFRTRIKFCGLTRAGDVRLAGELGVDAVGLIFAARSPRRVAPQAARGLRDALAPLVDVVALFMDNSVDEVREAIAHARPTLLQFHGGEDDAFCRKFGLPYLKGIGLRGAGASLSGRVLHGRYPHAAGFVLDGHGAGEAGGSGQRVDIAAIPPDMSKPYVLAGGLQPDNVFAAVRAASPWGVDVSSGIELEPGIKDGALMRRFVEEVRRADCVELGEDNDLKECYACGR